MKVLHYCQHVLGVGHFFRSLALDQALAPDDVLLVSGGPEAPAPLPKHVRHAPLSPLVMDESFKGFYSPQERDVEAVKTERSRELLRLLEAEMPDLLLIELYPFGRKKFRFELDPLLRAAASTRTKVVCSLRDILVERDDQTKFESRVMEALTGFDMVLVHSDPRVARLEETFPLASNLPCPLEYTGFVSRPGTAGARRAVREELGLGESDRLITASIGGGRVGGYLLRSVLEAFSLLGDRPDYVLRLYCGPFMEEDEYQRLRVRAHGLPRVTAGRFSQRFPDILAASDLSISMAGYNTCMDVLAAGIPALVLPFDANSEQAERAEKLAELGALSVLGSYDLFPEGLAARICEAVTKQRPSHDVDLGGADRSARILRTLAGGE
ncbi:glycosyltransferase family protein [Desulfohalovibrio reitneri]|uniref:glycosyltransferase family protein n=1 Tax=Desulfohalovibrio reitneri TaxID=1307759 RepID=UPI0004A7655D|nr:glycosyltransferase [Desulfohalovibrio reitneri]